MVFSSCLIPKRLSSMAPIFTLEEALLLSFTGHKYVKNSAGEVNGRLEYTGDGTEAVGAIYTPTVKDYPQDGTIELSESGDGKGSKCIHTHHQIVIGNGVYGIYDVAGSDYKIYAIHIKAGNKVDIYLGGKGTPIALSEVDKDYTIAIGDWVITDTPPDIIVPEVPENPNLVQDADFALGDETYWTPGGATFSWSETNFAGNLAVMDDGSWSRAGQVITLEDGVQYNIEYTYENKTDSDTNGIIGVGTSEGAGFPGSVFNNDGAVQTNTTDWVTLTDTFTASGGGDNGTTYYLALHSSSSNTAYFKEVKIWKA